MKHILFCVLLFFLLNRPHWETVQAATPRCNLSVSSSWLKPESSVNLTCSVNLSAEWRFFWFKAIPKQSNNSYEYELLPGSTGGTAQVPFIVDGQTHTAGYACTAGQGNKVPSTKYSKPRFVWSGDSPPASASVIVVPDKVQHFSGESVSLRCEGTSSVWRVMRRTEAGHRANCSVWGTMAGSTCLIKNITNNTAVYWCESTSGFSNAVNITVTRKDLILVSPVKPLTEGENVTLICKLRNKTFDSRVFFYRNDQLIQNDTRDKLHIKAVSLSDEGFYKCKFSEQMSPKSWISVKLASKNEGSSFPLQLIMGLLCGVFLIVGLLLILVLLFFQDNKSKDKSNNVTCSFIKPKNTKNEDDSVVYAQVILQNKKKCKKEEGDSSAAALNETIYSVVKM